MTLVKICGLTQEHDVLRAVELGAWACGFVLSSSSPRRVAPRRAAELAALCNGALTVAVVTTETPANIVATLAESACRAVQLSAGVHGAGVAEVRAAARAYGVNPLVIASADASDASDADLLLLDGRLPGHYGGTGCRADWEAAARLAGCGRLVLAGGLSPSTVAAAIGAVRPYAVDVASGVERSPGRKDAGLLHAFFAAVHTADRAAETAS